MPTFVALLRGVNVGKARRVPMADLRSLLSRLGYTGVDTLLNSGNAVFRAAGGPPAVHARAIAAALAERMDLVVPVIVKSARDLAAIVSDCPFEAAPSQHSRFIVAFVQDAKALADLAAIEPLVVPPERFAIGREAAYLLCPSGLLESQAGQALLGRTGSSATTRNWATVLKLRALADGATGHAA